MGLLPRCEIFRTPVASYKLSKAWFLVDKFHSYSVTQCPALMFLSLQITVHLGPGECQEYWDYVNTTISKANIEYTIPFQGHVSVWLEDAKKVQGQLAIKDNYHLPVRDLIILAKVKLLRQLHNRSVWCLMWTICMSPVQGMPCHQARVLTRLEAQVHSTSKCLYMLTDLQVDRRALGQKGVQQAFFILECKSLLSVLHRCICEI